jgi:ABC-type transporter Mla subunit MlaD
LVAAGAFLMLVLVLAVPIVRLRRTVDAATRALDRVADQVGPLLINVNATVENVNTALTQVHTSLDGVNVQLARLDTITGHAQTVTANVANLATVVTAAAANPLVKVVAFSYGVRKATANRRREAEEQRIREVLKEQRQEQRRAARRGQRERTPS